MFGSLTALRSMRASGHARLVAMMVLAAVSAVLLSCDGATEPRRPGQAASLQIVSGDQQEGVVGEELAEPLVVQVLDDEGQPVAGQIVNWIVTKGGGSVFAGAALTNAEGLAFEYWTIGTSVLEENVLEVRAVDPETREPMVYATFTANGLPGAPAGIFRAVNVPNQATVGQIMSPSPTVVVRDAFSNRVPGAEVTFEVVSGGGTVSPATVTTDAEGLATTAWTLGFSVGTHRLRARAAGVADSVEWATVVSPGSVSGGLVFVQPPPTTAESYEPFDVQPIVRLVDQSGAAVRVAGVPITVRLALSSHSGLVEGTTTVLTDEEGIARFTDLYIRSYGRTFVLNFTRQGFPPLQSQPITVLAWDYTLEKVAGDGETAAPGSTITVQVRLMDDATGQPVAGRTAFTWVKTGGGSVVPVSAETNAQGIATFEWTLGPSAGANELQVWVNDVVPVVFTATGQ